MIQHKNKIQYVWSTFFGIYNVGAEILEDYANNALPITFSSLDFSFFESQNASAEISFWVNWKDAEIPVLFTAEENNVLSQTTSEVSINVNILASAFYFLSGWQEFHSTIRDKYQRYPFNESFQKRHELALVPIVNYYFDILKTALEKAYKTTIKTHDQGADYSVFLSHDIDKCESAWIEGGAHALKKFRLLQFIKLIGKKVIGKDDWFNLEEIAKRLTDKGITSTFFFLAESEANESIKNADYKVSSKKYKSAIRELQTKGFEIGIHGSYGSSTDPARLKKEMNLLDAEISGNRFHFLDFRNQSIDTLSKAGIKYDSTLGFAESPGFRNGTCHPFFIYDIANDKATGILEIPLILMDATLLHSNYAGASIDEIIVELEKIISPIKEFNGVFSILWHNNAFSTAKYKRWNEAFEVIMKRISTDNVTFETGSQIYEQAIKRLV